MPHRCICLALATIAVATRAPAEVTTFTAAKDRVDRKALEQLARQIEPNLEGQTQRLPQYIDFFRRQLGNDQRLFAFEVTTESHPTGRVKISGFVEFPETHAALLAFLRVLGFVQLDDQLESLPAASLGQRNLGFLKATHSLSYDRPSGQREIVTDCLLGEPLYLLREADQHLLVHGGEGYLGYVRSEDIQRVDAAEFARYLSGPRACVDSDWELGSGPRIPAGARLKCVRQEADTVLVELPGGGTVAIPASCCDVRRSPVARIDQVLEKMRRLLGTKYLWGGKTSAGIDCSGLVQVAFASAGMHLPRDSNQQVYLGRLTATRWCTAGLERGDTLYFIGRHGRIRHTGIYLGENQFVHATSPVVVVGSFDPKDHNYDARRHSQFAFAKRLAD